jgi:hypothetical protein
MSRRVEFEKPMSVAGESGRIYVSCGRQDDYLEFALPSGATPGAAVRDRLASIACDPACDHLDVRFEDGSPATVSILALYAGVEHEVQQALPYEQRLANLLLRLAQAEPTLDFGDLLPERPVAAAPAEPPQPGPCVAQPPAGPAPAALTHPDATPRAAGVEPAQTMGSPSVEPHRVAEVAVSPVRPAEAGSAALPAQAARAADLLSRATDLATHGHSHKARRAVEDALREDPTNSDAWGLRQELIRLEAREKRRQREPRNPQAQLEAGFSYLSLGCDDAAVEAFRLAARLQPDLYLAHLLLGIAHHHRKQMAEAQLAYERAARLQPTERVPRQLLASLRRGEPPPRPVEDRPGVGGKPSRGLLTAGLAAAG